jgi:hypothetical protein
VTGLKIMISLNKSKVPYEELIEAARRDVPLINDAKMEWKIWLENKEERIIGGIYCFKDEEDFKKSLARGKAKGFLPPLIENISNQVFDINENLSKMNKAPI